MTDTETTPVRVQRKRTKGYRTPLNTVYVGRPTKYGNPYRISVHGAAEAVEMFRETVRRFDAEDLELIRQELGGKNLSCWCPIGSPCHADVLLEVANRKDAQ